MTVSRFTWYCGTELPGEIMAAALDDYRFEPHFHDAWSIGAIADGACAFSCLGAQWVARRGDVVVIAPRVVHTGGTAKAGLKYGMAYIDPAWFGQHAALVHRDGVGFEQIVIRDEALCEQWVAALTASELSSQERALALSTALLALLTRHGVPAAHAGDATRASENVCGQAADNPAMSRLRTTDATDRASEELRRQLTADTPVKADVTATARRWGVHRTTLVKHFTRRYGLPPDAWLRNWRIARAKVLMMRGAPLADIAAQTGFADQAHLTRVFKRIHGSAPGTLRKAFAQEPAR